nr:hypothetical protein [Parafrankia sp. Ea1.12]
MRTPGAATTYSPDSGPTLNKPAADRDARRLLRRDGISLGAEVGVQRRLREAPLS